MVRPHPRLRRRLLRAAAAIAILCAGAVGCQQILETGEESKRANGLTCQGAAQCLSGFCVQDLCCDSACDGACESCNGLSNVEAVDGECGTLVPWYDLDDGC